MAIQVQLGGMLPAGSGQAPGQGGGKTQPGAQLPIQRHVRHPPCVSFVLEKLGMRRARIQVDKRSLAMVPNGRLGGLNRRDAIVQPQGLQVRNASPPTHDLTGSA